MQVWGLARLKAVGQASSRLETQAGFADAVLRQNSYFSRKPPFLLLISLTD